MTIRRHVLSSDAEYACASSANIFVTSLSCVGASRKVDKYCQIHAGSSLDALIHVLLTLDGDLICLRENVSVVTFMR